MYPLANWAVIAPVYIICTALFYLVIFGMFTGAFCWKHFRWKRRYYVAHTAYYTECESCAEEHANPRVQCGCGWRGHLEDLQAYSYDEDRYTRYYCPSCEKEVKP